MPRRAFIPLLIALSLSGCGTLGPVDVPDQSQFPPLATELAKAGPFVRLYASEIFPIPAIAVHLSFVVKFANSSTIEKWELQPGRNTMFGHVVGQPETDIASLVAEFSSFFIVADAPADQAAAIADFIHTQSPRYPCRFAYDLFGPNSNTYIAWVLQQTNWRPPLPSRAIGKDAAVKCP